ncbi:LuxR family transcriptional regulator [Kitasatospora sp. NPDC094015]|uniref:LuxR family transcriptional regulator n=1 Tax=Kitasatospora sp. NPDC094015 TaxID=3155205 RepID=UPI00331DC879
MSAASALPGRQDELGALARAVEQFGAGRGAVLEIVGDPGIGKTALLNRLAALAADRGAAVLRARARPEDAKPYQLFRDAWDSAEPPCPGGPSWDTAAERDLVRALRTLPERYGPGGPEDGGARGGGARGDGTDGGGPGAVLILDDLHHGDPASIRLAERLVGGRPPYLLALAHRPRQTPPALLAALDEAQQAGTLHRIEPAPLDAAAVAAVLAGAAADGRAVRGAEQAERLRAAAGGNPRILRVLLAAGADPQLWPERAAGAAGPLLRAAAPLIAEFDALSVAATEVLAAAAVLGETFLLGELAQVAGHHPDHTAEAVAELTRADLFRPGGPAGDLTFRHPVLGHLVHHRIAPGLRLRAHRRALALLEARHAGAAARARHAEHALLGGDRPDLVAVLAEGAAEVYASAPAAAARWLGAALAALPATGPGAEHRVALGLDRCRALTAAGRLEEARTLAHDLLRTPGGLPEQRRTAALAACVEVERLLGRYAEADAMARTVIDTLPRPLPAPLAPETVQLVFDHGLVHALRGTAAEVRTLAHEAAAAAGAAEVTAATAAAGSGPDDRTALRVLAAFCDSYAGDLTRVGPEVARCGRLVDARPDTVAGRAPEVLALLGCAELYLERFADAHRHLSRGLAVAGGGAHKHVAVNHLIGLSTLENWAGRLDLAQRHAREAERLGTELGAPDAVGMAMAMRASALLWTLPARRTPEAVALAERGLRHTVPGTGWWGGSALGLLALARLVGGDPQDCLRTLLEGGGEDLEPLQPASRPSLFALMTTAAVHSGDLDLARRSARAADAAAGGLGRPSFQQAQADRAGSALAAAEGDHGRSAELAAKAAEAFRALRMPVLHAWTVLAVTVAVARAHGPAAAIGPLDEAIEGARRCGALRLCEDGARMRAALVAAGPPGSSDPSPVAGLSAREREVAELAAAGLPTRVIAERLVLSPRTVDTHLGSAYRKLGVGSRLALARLLHRPPGAD